MDIPRMGVGPWTMFAWIGVNGGGDEHESSDESEIPESTAAICILSVISSRSEGGESFSLAIDVSSFFE